MDALRIAVELFGHAVAYYAAGGLYSIAKKLGINISVLKTIMKEAGDLNVNNDDKKAWAYYAVWWGVGFIKAFMPGRLWKYFIL